jgi:auxin efflux carrier family protein
VGLQSNSLPIAIVSSLAYTLDKDLYWDKIAKDSAQQVVSRGILYLLIFAQYIPAPDEFQACAN